MVFFHVQSVRECVCIIELSCRTTHRFPLRCAPTADWPGLGKTKLLKRGCGAAVIYISITFFIYSSIINCLNLFELYWTAVIILLYLSAILSGLLVD